MYGGHHEAFTSAKQEAKSQKLARVKKMKTAKNDVNERHLGPHERAMFKEAKVKELKSFFDHGVWTFQTKSEADEARTLTSRIILKWSKHPDGSPRAKARLIVRGYNDPDIGWTDPYIQSYHNSLVKKHCPVTCSQLELEHVDG